MERKPNVILQGGPKLPDDQRLRYAENTNEKLKLLRGHRYDHFEPTTRTFQQDGQELVVFAWSGYTYVAE